MSKKIVNIMMMGLFFLLAFGLTGCGGGSGGDGDGVSNNTPVEQTLIETARALNSQTPMMVDGDTRLDTVVVVNTTILYKYTLINYSYNVQNKSTFESSVRTLLTRNVCSNTAQTNLFKYDVIYSYMYYDKNGVFITTIDISKNSCN